ncbi:sensor histidine kinase [Agreia pratensis]|uniref:histidine kinase n=1 Tax=Agreia pratensis TaxID=150121 RepID=A0A1X7JFX6_9MICO|nr:sensor histidine kinase [Agreia pratensis]MBF4635009.1 sensor histidine kinase [Agreia pratensis]SMG26673.1 Sensor histidine kinase regulating citrate/malate metabolism [Agreia pratensis]
MNGRRRRVSIAARLFAVQAVFVIAAVGLAVALLALDARGRATADASARSMVTAEAVAHNPFVIEAVQQPDPSSVLQPYAVTLMDDTHVDFITVMAPDRTRYTHRDPEEIGKPFIGTIAPALAGKSFTETYTGTLGPSVRAVVPIRGDDGSVTALVSAGITLSQVDATFWPRVHLLLGAGAVMIALGALVSWLFSRYLRRVTAGRGAEELGQVFAYYESVLHSVREGLVLVDAHGVLVLYNDHAADLLGLTAGGPARPVDELDIPASLKALLLQDEEARDEVFVTRDHVLVVNHQPALPTEAQRGAGRIRSLGTVTTLRDRTELLRVTGELESMRTMSDALRSQTHEFANRLHTIASLLELGRSDEALRFAADELNLSQRLADRVLVSVDEPVIAALMLGKAAQARERGVALKLETHLDPGTQGFEPADVVTILGNLVDNALDAAASGTAPGVEPWVEVYLGLGDGEDDLVVQVSDSGPGIDHDARERVFGRGYSTKETDALGRGIGLALVRQTVARLGGTIELSEHVGAVFTVTLPMTARVDS